jgi:hypothetical protein
LAACGHEAPPARLVFATDSLTSSFSDFAVHVPQAGVFAFKNAIRNQINLYQVGNGQLINRVNPPWHLQLSANLQSINWLHPDTLLVLMKHTPEIYYFDRYGHCYRKDQLAQETALAHYSVSGNRPEVYRRRLYIPLLPTITGPARPQHFAETRELVVDLASGKVVDTFKIAAPAGPHLLGLRHQLAVRTRVGDQLVYLWGHGGPLARLDLRTGRVTHQALPIKMDPLPAFTANYADNYEQQRYYFAHPVYDHLSYDPHRQQYYLFRVEPVAAYRPKYQRPFTILVLDAQGKLKKQQLYNPGEYYLDHEIITEGGLYLMRQQPQPTNELVFERLNLE